jgi:hypothetical protein
MHLPQLPADYHLLGALPFEVLVGIFSMLEPYDLCAAASASSVGRWSPLPLIGSRNQLSERAGVQWAVQRRPPVATAVRQALEGAGGPDVEVPLHDVAASTSRAALPVPSYSRSFLPQLSTWCGLTLVWRAM